MTTLTFDIFSPDHLDAAIGLSRAVFWPHRREDWEMLLALSSGVVALRDGTVVGTALRTEFGAEVSTTNMIIVAEEERGRGLGRKLMDAVMTDAAGREFRLIATAEGVPLYTKLGFETRGEIGQHQGVLPAIDAPARAVEAAAPDDLARVTALENAAFAADRSALMSWLFAHAQVAVTRDQTGQITGYAAMRDFGRGHVIGPVCARDVQEAKALIQHFAHGMAGQFVRIDSDAQSGLATWLETLGLPRIAGGTVMRRDDRTAPEPRFALCSQALG